MELITLDLEIPEVIKEVDLRMKRLSKKTSVICGGCLSDLYMGKMFKDIDVFLEDGIKEEEIEKVFGTKMTCVREKAEDYSGIESDLKIYQFEFQGHAVEIIEVENIRRVFDFDFRFRQFYLIDGVVQASKGAMEDIQEKKMTIVNPFSAVSTMCRIVYFKRKYGFEVEPMSQKLLMNYINFSRYDGVKAKEFIRTNERLLAEEKALLLEQFEGATKQVGVTRAVSKFGNGEVEIFEETQKVVEFEDADFPLDPAIREELFRFICRAPFDIRHDAGILGACHDRLMHYRFQGLTESFTLRLDESLVPKLYEEVWRDTRELYNKSRIKFLTEAGNPEILRLVEEELASSLDPDDPTKGKLLVKKFLKKVARTWGYNATSSKAEKLYTRLDRMPVVEGGFTCTWRPEGGTGRIADILKGNTCELVVERSGGRLRAVKIEILFRKCTNGKYTISAVRNQGDGLRQNDSWAIIRAVQEKLSAMNPDLFIFGDSTVVGLYDEASSTNDHYFFSLEDMFSKHRTLRTEDILKNKEIPFKLSHGAF